MKLLITGGAGFIGRALLRALPPETEVVVVDSLVEDVHGADAAFPDEVARRARCIRCDLRDVDGWRHAVTGTDVVVHLASLTGTGQGMYQQARYREHNVLATSRLCEVLSAMRPRPYRVVLTSSRAVYGEGAFLDGDAVVHPAPRRADALAAGQWEIAGRDGRPLTPAAVAEQAPAQPASVYGLTKLEQERLLSRFATESELDLIVFRLQNVYGPWQQTANPYAGIVGTLVHGVLGAGAVELFEDGEMTRDFVFVDDVVAALLAGVRQAGPVAATFNVGSGHSESLRDVVRLLGDLTGRTPAVAISGRYRVGDIRHARADMRAYELAFGSWRARGLADGLREYLDWYVTQPAASAAPARALDELQQHGLLRGGRPCP